MESINYHDEEMMAICRDELFPHLIELEAEGGQREYPQGHSGRTKCIN
jgi:hypothetical protein